MHPIFGSIGVADPAGGYSRESRAGYFGLLVRVVKDSAEGLATVIIGAAALNGRPRAFMQRFIFGGKCVLAGLIGYHALKNLSNELASNDSIDVSPDIARYSAAQISKVQELQRMEGSHGHFELAANIDGFALARSISSFSGKLDGKGYTIKGLNRCLFKELKGEVTNLNVVGANIDVITPRSTKSLDQEYGIVACRILNADINNVNVTDSKISVTALDPPKLVLNSPIESGAVCVGGIAGAAYRNNVLQNIHSSNNAISGKAKLSAIAGGVLGKAHKDACLVAENLNVHNATITALSCLQIMSGGAIGDASHACNQFEGVLTCNDVSVMNSTVMAFNAGRSYVVGHASGIFNAGKYTPCSRNYAFMNNNVDADGCVAECVLDSFTCEPAAWSTKVNHVRANDYRSINPRNPRTRVLFANLAENGIHEEDQAQA